MDPLFAPTVVYYIPDKDVHARVIGMFDYETIKGHEDNLLGGKVHMDPLAIKKKDLTLSDIDCPNYQLALEEEDDDFAEMLAELLAEEEARKAEEKDDDEDSSSQKKGKKNKGKKKKKSKKGGAKDEL